MSRATADFELGTDGATILAADPGSATAWDLVTIGASGGAVTYDNDHVSLGTLAGKLVAGSGGAKSSLRWSTGIGSLTDHYGAARIWTAAYPASASPVVQALNTGSNQVNIRWRTDGRIEIRDAGGAMLIASTDAVPLNSWFRLEWHMIHNATTGSVELRIFHAGATMDAHETLIVTNANTGTVCNQLDFIVNAASQTIWLDELIAGATAFPGDLTLTYQISFTNNPFAASPAWSDVTPYWQDGQFISPQRSFELDLISSGGGASTFDNQDRRFEPEYTSSPYSPFVIPMRKARLSAVLDSTTYYIWTGYVDTWPPLWPTPGDSLMQIRLVDAMAALERKGLVGTYSQEASGTRIGNVLDDYGFPAADRSIDAGQETIIAKTFALSDSKTALQHIRDVLTSEGPTAAFFINGQGFAVFHDRHKRIKAPYTTSQATFGDADSGEIPYEVVTPDFPSDLLFNEAAVTREGGTTQSTSDSTSQTTYGTRTRENVSTLQVSDTNAAGLAAFIVSRYKDPALRFEGIEIAPLNNFDIWQTALTLKIGDRVTVKRRPPEHPSAGGTVISKDCHIEGITWTFSQPERWGVRVRYLLTPADQNGYWVLGDAVNGLLGTTTRLAY